MEKQQALDNKNIVLKGNPKAIIVVAVTRVVVVVAIRYTAVVRIVVPTTTTQHPVSTFMHAC
jgi:hypothetical protein